jgi:hydroxymethylglutaryl-CoA lyase
MLEKMPPKVKVVEVGPRDGLQNEARAVPTEDKVRLIEALAGTGLQHIELTSFVSPKWIPQLADALQVVGTVKLPPTVTTSALVPNMKGYESAKQAGLKQVAVFMSATESHSKKNINKSIDEALQTLAEVVAAAKGDGKSVRGYLSVVFHCPYEGKTDPEKVAPLVRKLFDLGIDELSLGDTVGAATPAQVLALLTRLQGDVDSDRVALHFHDTFGTALSNVVAGLDSGISIFDASIGGMGGCPYAPGAAGNLATEDLVYMLEGMGVSTGIDLDKLVDCGQLAESIVQHKLPGRCLQARLAQRAKQLTKTS